MGNIPALKIQFSGRTLKTPTEWKKNRSYGIIGGP